MSSNLSAAAKSLFNPAFLRSWIADRQARAFDRRYGTDTRAKMPVSEMTDVNPDLTRHAVHYEASAIPKFRRAMRVIERTGSDLRSYSFVDFGSGKGLVVMLASRYPFKRVHGVEMTPALHEIAAANTRSFVARTGTKTPISLECMDALQFVLPEGDLIAYLYNPFDALLTAQFVQRLTAAVGSAARSVLVAYINPAHRVLFDDDPHFTRLFQDATLVVYRYAGRAGTTR